MVTSNTSPPACRCSPPMTAVSSTGSAAAISASLAVMPVRSGEPGA
jgi:hypothetical protein